MSTATASSDALAGLAAAMGILPRWRSVAGKEQTTGPDTQRALLHAMGMPVATDAEVRESLADLRARRAARRIPEEIVRERGQQCPFSLPACCPLAARTRIRRRAARTRWRSGRAVAAGRTSPPALERRDMPRDRSADRAPAVGDVAGRKPGLGLFRGPLRTVFRSQPWGGDYRDLADAARQMARLGADFIGINPVHARGAASKESSPYSPSCHSALEPRHIAADAVPGIERCAAARQLLKQRAANREAANGGGLLDYEAHTRRQREVLEAAFRSTMEASGPAAADFAAWRQGPGRELEWYALFEALAGVHGPDWRAWPEALKHIHSPEVQQFALEHEESARRHAWQQWLAHRQLGEAQAARQESGHGLWPVSRCGSGRLPRRRRRMVGAGLLRPGRVARRTARRLQPPGPELESCALQPAALRAAAYRPFIRMLRFAMAHAGMVRIDHVLGLKRSFWVPESGAPGRLRQLPAGIPARAGSY